MLLFVPRAEGNKFLNYFHNTLPLSKLLAQGRLGCYDKLQNFFQVCMFAFGLDRVAIRRALQKHSQPYLTIWIDLKALMNVYVK